MRSNVFEAFISGQSPGKTSEFPRSGKTSELSGVPPAKPPIRSGKTSEIGLQVIDLNN
jgi:hypothetical protein